MNVLRRIRDALPASWFQDIDYDTSQDIDWNDDFDPSEPRVPKGAPGGGQWTAGGGVAAPASPALTKYAGPVGAKFKKLIDAHFAEMTNTTATPDQIKAKVAALSAEMKTEAGKFKSSNVAGYINQLIAHLEATHGYPAGSLGKAVKLKGEPGLALVPPSDEEIEKMAAALEPTGYAAPEPEPAPLAPPPGAHPNVGKIAEIVANKWGADEKLAWVQALAGDIPPDDTQGTLYAQDQMDKLKVQQGIEAGGAIPGWTAPTPATSPAGLPEPTLNTQKKIAAIVNGEGAFAGMDTPSKKIAAIEAMLQNITHQPNIDYANQALALLKGGTPAAEPEPEAAPAGATMTAEEEAALLNKLPAPAALKKNQGEMWLIASDPSLTAEGKIAQIETMQSVMAFPEDQEFAKKTIAALKGETAVAAEATGPDLLKYMTGPGEQAALEKAIPMPGGPQAEQDLWETAAMKGWTAASKILQLEADMTPGGIAEAGSSPQSKQTNAYAQSLIDFLKGYDSSKQPGPQLVQQPAPPADWPQAPGGIGGNTFVQNLAAMATNGSNTSAQLQDYFDNKLAMGDIFPDGEVANYTKKIIAWKAAQEGGGAAPTTPTSAIPLTSNWPLPSNNPQQTLFTNIQNAATPLKQHQLLNNIATSSASPELKSYAKALKAALGPDPSAAAQPADPTAIPAIPANLKNSSEVAKIYQLATAYGYDSSQVETWFQNAAGNGFTFAPSSEAETYAKSVIAAMKAKEGKTTSTAPVIPIHGANAGKFKTIYNAATHPTQPLAQKIAAVEAVVMNTKVGGAYKLSVLAALKAAGPKAAPEPPPATLEPPDPGSNTQTSMFAIANKTILHPQPMTNEEKVAEITKILANSTGSAGGKAETYANKLITALGGQATTKTAAVAANAPTPITPKPYSGGGTVGTPAAPQKHLSFGSEVDTSLYPSWTNAMPKPTPAERTAVAKYTGHYYGEINTKMRSGVGLEGDIKEWAKNLHIFLDRASFPQDAVLTRKVSGEYAKSLIASMKKGAMFVDHGFVSSDNWSGDLTVKIHIKKGAKAAFVDSISSNKGSEKEVIIQNGAHFRITDYDVAQKHLTCDLLDPSDPDYFL